MGILALADRRTLRLGIPRLRFDRHRGNRLAAISQGGRFRCKAQHCQSLRFLCASSKIKKSTAVYVALPNGLHKDGHQMRQSGEAHPL